MNLAFTRKILTLVFVLFALSAFIFFNDQAIVDKIAEELSKDPSIGAYNVSAYSEYGHVYLRGTVSSERARERVFDIARSIENVREVTNQLTVVPAKAGNDKEAKLICGFVLENIKDVGTHKITVECKDGIVYLSGVVANQNVADRIMQRVQITPGVTRVISQFKYPDPVSDDELRSRLAEAFSKESGLALNTVSYSVKDGVAVFNGNVSRHEEIDRILGIALMVDGVKDIKSNVSIGK